MLHPNDARLQITAGATLLDQSRLVEWWAAEAQFVRVHDDTFEYSARHDVHPAFGRLICWLLFSAGAEYLAKGLCLAYGIQFWDNNRPAKICEFPKYPIPEWLKKTNGRPKRDIETTSYGTIGNLTYGSKGKRFAVGTTCPSVEGQH